MVVGASAAMLVVELARASSVAPFGDQEAAGHAEMHDEHLAGREVGEEVFGPAAERRDRLALEALREALREGEAQVRPALLDLVDAGADHGGLEAAADGFDFGKFGHGINHLASRPDPSHSR